MTHEPQKDESREYWDGHPIGVEPFEKEVGSSEFYKEYIEYYDRFYEYKWRVFEYEKYRDCSVLEIGCGLGIDTVKFAQHGAMVTAVDISSTSVRSTQRLLGERGLPGTVCQANAENLPFQDGSFDAVYAYGVIMHIPDESKAVAEIYRVLKTDGLALAVLYHRRSWYWLLAKLSKTPIESEAGDPPVVRVFSKTEARNLFRQFSTVSLTLERFPRRTKRRGGLGAFLFNWVFVPVVNLLPRALTRHFGWHIIVKARKAGETERKT